MSRGEWPWELVVTVANVQNGISLRILDYILKSPPTEQKLSPPFKPLQTQYYPPEPSHPGTRCVPAVVRHEMHTQIVHDFASPNAYHAQQCITKAMRFFR